MSSKASQSADKVRQAVDLLREAAADLGASLITASIPISTLPGVAPLVDLCLPREAAPDDARASLGYPGTYMVLTWTAAGCTCRAVVLPSELTAGDLRRYLDRGDLLPRDVERLAEVRR